jgi:hypothetical protein
MLGGRKGVNSDSFSSAWHESSVTFHYPGPLGPFVEAVMAAAGEDVAR